MNYMNIKYKKEGFTLIELLVVIAIIGVLASIVISSLNNSRTKANDTKLKSQLSGVRRSAELYYDNQSPNGYTLSTMPAPALPCTGTMFIDANSGMLQYTGTGGNNWPANTLLSCQATAIAYAVSANLQAPGLPATADHWCVDSAGSSKAIGAQLASGDTLCD